MGPEIPLKALKAKENTPGGLGNILESRRGVDMKKCGKCQILKPKTEFHWKNRKLEKKNNWCKDCRKEYDNKTRMNRYIQNRLKHIANLHNRKYGGNVTEQDLQKCLDFFDDHDAYIGEKFKEDGTKSEQIKNSIVFDHIVPISLGGKNKIGNIVPTTKRNSSIKANTDLDQYLADLPDNQKDLIGKWMKINS